MNRKVYAVRHHNGSVRLQGQPLLAVNIKVDAMHTSVVGLFCEIHLRRGAFQLVQAQSYRKHRLNASTSCISMAIPTAEPVLCSLNSKMNLNDDISGDIPCCIAVA